MSKRDMRPLIMVILPVELRSKIATECSKPNSPLASLASPALKRPIEIKDLRHPGEVVRLQPLKVSSAGE